MVIGSKYFPSIGTYHFAPTLPSETLRVLRDEGRDRTESLVFWAGRLLQPDAEVRTIIVPRGPRVELHSTHVVIPDDTMARVAETVDPPEVVLLAQVHTHRGSAFHSPVDDFYGFRSPGFISAVIGNYGIGAPASMETWAVFECLDGAQFRRLSSDEVSQRFRPRNGLTVKIAQTEDA